MTQNTPELRRGGRNDSQADPIGATFRAKGRLTNSLSADYASDTPHNLRPAFPNSEPSLNRNAKRPPRLRVHLTCRGNWESHGGFMTLVSMRILAFAAVASLPLLAQQPSPTPQPPAGSSPQTTSPQQTNPEPGASQNSNPQAVPAPGTANSPEVSNPQLQPVTGELENKLDTKDAKAGDSVVVKTTQTATIGNGMEIPKGSEIKGHIIDVAPKGQ